MSDNGALVTQRSGRRATPVPAMLMSGGAWVRIADGRHLAS